jgi:DNA replication protein DnaC
MSDASLHDRLRALGLSGAADGLDDLVALATQKRWGPVQIFEHIADIEERERSRRGLERRLSRSHLGRFKTIADYDWNWPTKIDRPLVESAVGLHFLGAARNVVLVAPQGLGKTMIAQNIAHQAIVAGHSVLFTTAAQMLLDLGGQESSRALERRLRHYAKQSLLVLDEVGYLAFDNRNADLLFQVVSRRYERKSLVLTTNLAFVDWPTILGAAPFARGCQAAAAAEG